MTRTGSCSMTKGSGGTCGARSACGAERTCNSARNAVRTSYRSPAIASQRTALAGAVLGRAVCGRPMRARRIQWAGVARTLALGLAGDGTDQRTWSFGSMDIRRDSVSMNASTARRVRALRGQSDTEICRAADGRGRPTTRMVSGDGDGEAARTAPILSILARSRDAVRD